MGTTCDLPLAGLFLDSYEAEFFQKLLQEKHLLWPSTQH